MTTPRWGDSTRRTVRRTNHRIEPHQVAPNVATETVATAVGAMLVSATEMERESRLSAARASLPKQRPLSSQGRRWCAIHLCGSCMLV